MMKTLNLIVFLLGMALIAAPAHAKAKRHKAQRHVASVSKNRHKHKKKQVYGAIEGAKHTKKRHHKGHKPAGTRKLRRVKPKRALGSSLTGAPSLPLLG